MQAFSKSMDSSHHSFQNIKMEAPNKIPNTYEILLRCMQGEVYDAEYQRNEFYPLAKAEVAEM